MSGFVNPNAGGGYRFVYINDYKFKTTPTDQERQDFPNLIKFRTKENGTQVEEIETTMLEGRLVEIGQRDVTFEPGFENYVVIENEDGKFRVSLKYMGRQFLSILQRLPGVREDLPIQLHVFSAPVEKDPTKKMALVYIKQQDSEGKWTKVENQFPYDKENPDKNIMPGFNKVMLKGKAQYDPTPQYEWLMNNAAHDYTARLSKLVIDPTKAGSPPVQKKAQATVTETVYTTASGEHVMAHTRTVPAPTSPPPARPHPSQAPRPQAEADPAEGHYVPADDDLPF